MGGDAGQDGSRERSSSPFPPASGSPSSGGSRPYLYGHLALGSAALEERVGGGAHCWWWWWGAGQRLAC